MGIDVVTLALAKGYTDEKIRDAAFSDIPLDTSLTKNGQAADAKAVGDRLQSLSKEMLTQEADPTVPAWAKQPTKPTYTASEVGALPDTYTPPNQTAEQVGADPAGTAASAVSQHNTDAAAHNDLRLALQGLSDRINAALDSDDSTLDQMSEVVAYIKSNKSMIDAITTSKVSMADIVDNLTTNVSNKPLSAAQGVVIKTLIDALRNDKLDADELANAVNTALAQAKASGEFDGPQGPVGPKGDTGDTGPQGPQGDSGPQGPQGEIGPAGPAGANGADGITPTIGDNGNWYLGNTDTGKPSRGKMGPQGPKGDTGPIGPAGPKGDTGATGPKGDKGDIGPAGPKGDTGDVGPAGPKGDTGGTGPQGPKGDKGADGQDGAPGKNGITPHIGENGNWYLGETDTGLPSRGEQGPGEEVFYIDLEGNYPDYTCSVAMADITAAYDAGKVLECRCVMYPYIATLPLFVPMPIANTWIFSGSGALAAMGFPAQSLTIAIVNGVVQASDTKLVTMNDQLPNPHKLSITSGDTAVTYDGSTPEKIDIPTALPNPNALTFTGAVTGSYDGSAPLSIKIPVSSGETIPEYARTEAETVARIVNQHQSNDSIVFPFLSDAHCGYYTDTGNAATTLAGQLLNQIGKRIPYDFIVHGGDFSTGAWNTTKQLSFEQIEDYTELTSEANKGVPSIWTVGNHDDSPYQATEGRVSQQETFALIGRKNRISGAVCPNGCNYGYLDLENRKLRVLYLDTDDKRSWGTVQVGSGETAPAYLNAHNVGGAQLQWLAGTALDFTGKGNPAEWGIVVVSHVALNISGTITDAVSGTTYAHSTANAAMILNAYRTGKSGSITHNGITVDYDFSTVESKATVICAVHGHDHKFCTETLTGGILSIGCPNVMNGRERASDDGNTYTKTAGTADGTSFCILTIDRENCMIYADCVGVGYDREFTYTTEAIAYTNQIPISIDTDGSVYGYQVGYRLGSSGTPSAESASYITGFIPVSVGDTVYMKNVTFKYGVSSGLTSNNQRLSFYDASKKHIVQTNATGLGGVAAGVKGDDNIWTQFTPKSTMNSIDCSGIAYFRINAAYIGDDSIITVNEPIE